MEATPLPTSDGQDWAEQFDQSLNQQRDRVREFLATQQERLQRVEAELGEHVQRLADELIQNRDQTQQAKQEIEQRSRQITQDAESLQTLQEELAARQAQWEQLQQRADQQQQALLEQIRQQQDELDHRHQELKQRQTEANQAEAGLHQQQRAVELARGEHQADTEQLAKQRQALEAKQVQLEDQARQIAVGEADIKSQRQQIADAEAEIQNQRRRIETDLHETAQRAELTQQLQSAQSRAAELSGELDSLRQRCQRLEQEAQTRPAHGGDASEELDRLRAERDELSARLTETEQRLTEAPLSPEAADEELQRRYEMAVEDVRELKAENAELQQRLARAPAASAGTPAPGGALDWEAEKQRVLASLEGDFDAQDEEDLAERARIEELTQKTDRLLADRDREIDELKQLLETQSSKVGSMAVGAAALGEMLDNDALIQEERENLKRMQDEWREKSRKAEVDISVERAKIARERAQLEDRIRVLENRGIALLDAPDEDADSEKPARGRWLSRLGLGGQEKETQ